MRFALALLLLTTHAVAVAQSCTGTPVQLQILGSGGVDLADTRAGTAALLWIDGKARLLLDTGPGAALRFAQSGARLADLDAILLSQLRAGHSADLPALLQLPVTPPRARSLPLYGPAGNRWMPSTVTFVRTLFDPTRGAWRHLGDMLSPLTRGNYKLEPHDLRARPAKLGVAREQRDEPLAVFDNDDMKLTAITVTDGQTPALVWRIEVRGKHLVLGATTTADASLQRFATGADLLVAAQPLANGDPLGKFAASIEARQLVLVARPRAGDDRQGEVESALRRHVGDALRLADDLDCVTP